MIAFEISGFVLGIIATLLVVSLVLAFLYVRAIYKAIIISTVMDEREKTNDYEGEE